MALSDLKIDSAGLRDILLSAQVRRAIESRAAAVAVSARSTAEYAKHGVQVTVTPDPTDRARFAVIAESPLGLRIEARHGTLVRAAAATGLEIKAWARWHGRGA